MKLNEMRTKDRSNSSSKVNIKRGSMGEQEQGQASEGLQKLFVEQLQDLYSAENQLIKALPKLSKAASSSNLKSAFDEHLQVTEEHASRIEQILSELNEKPGRVKCEGMAGLVKEGDHTIKEDEEDPVMKDAALIAAAQRVEHYEMAGYGTVRTFAEKLGLSEAVELLQKTLEEEKEADEKLTEISESLLADVESSQNESSSMDEESGEEADSSEGDEMAEESEEDEEQGGAV
jgi:ferritin-like metal-binding protein YciE